DHLRRADHDIAALANAAAGRDKFDLIDLLYVRQRRMTHMDAGKSSAKLRCGRDKLPRLLRFKLQAEIDRSHEQVEIAPKGNVAAHRTVSRRLKDQVLLVEEGRRHLQCDRNG